MELLKCPICARGRLMYFPVSDRVHPEAVVCQNEDYIHLQIGDNHFLAHTPDNMREEVGKMEELAVLN